MKSLKIFKSDAGKIEPGQSAGLAGDGFQYSICHRCGGSPAQAAEADLAIDSAESGSCAQRWKPFSFIKTVL